MICTLEDLVAPLPRAEFLARLRRRELTFLRGAGARGTLLSWQGLRDVIARGGFPLDKFRVTQESKQVGTPFYVTLGKVDLAKLDLLQSKGISVIFSFVEPHIPALAALCRAVEEEVNEKVVAHAVVTTGAGGALPLHHDTEDIFILQLEGSKRWQIHGPPVPNPVSGMVAPPPPAGAPSFDEVLEPGDSLFVPAGHWHHCENGPGLSLHVAVSFEPPTAWQALRPLVRQLLAEEEFRIPLSRLQSGADLAALEARLKARLTEMAGALSLRDFLAEKR